MKPKQNAGSCFTRVDIADLIFTEEYKNTVSVSFLKRPFEMAYLLKTNFQKNNQLNILGKLMYNIVKKK